MLVLLQDILQRIYSIELGASVEDFVITDRRLATLLAGPLGPGPEQLLVREEGGMLEMSLFLDPGLLEPFGERAGPEALRGDNLNAFCTLVEGVSHFVYLFRRASRDQEVTQLELELQAEVDKFAVLGLLLKAQRSGTLPAWLPRRLFEEVRFRAGLPAEALDRYRHANRLAHRYCERLRRRFAWAWNGNDFVAELRRFYRMGQPQKLRHIGSAA